MCGDYQIPIATLEVVQHLGGQEGEPIIDRADCSQLGGQEGGAAFRLYLEGTPHALPNYQNLGDQEGEPVVVPHNQHLVDHFFEQYAEEHIPTWASGSSGRIST